MEQEQIPAAYLTGTLLQNRYKVEDLLGRGGFGAVYLVKDQQSGHFAAIKELRDQNTAEQQRLLLECEILQRVAHPSLPQVRGVFEENRRIYMIMEYIEGPNLEILRKRQPKQRFSFLQVVALIQPIIEAVTYLHQQQPPLMHRDIKPANIIVPVNGDRTALVDFGVAKEYHDDATTTAIRHCSPGYSSPEQYSSMGTDPRADVYGLGATCYTLLTGTPPNDALQRMTKMASKQADPLLPISELTTDVPPAAAAAIQRALSINYERRFSTAEEFWQAFNAEEAPPDELEDEQATYTMSARQEIKSGDPVTDELKTRKLTSPTWRLLVVLIILLLLFGALGSAFWIHSIPSNTHTTANTSTAFSSPTRVASVKPADGNYPSLKVSYEGTLDSVLSQKTTNMTLTDIQQHAQTIQGAFTDRAQSRKQNFFSGVVDTSNHLLFTVAGQAGEPTLFFDGVVRTDGYLVGNYCTIDGEGQCVTGDYGLWSLTPSHT